MNRRQIRGFTLIEIAVALIIVALAVLAVAPSIGAWLRNSEVRNAADALVSGLERARNEAVRRNEDVTLWLVSTSTAQPGLMAADCQLDATSASWVIARRDPSNNCTNGASDVNDPMIVQTHSRAEGSLGVVASARTSGGAAAATSVSFNGFGRVTNAGAISQIDFSPVVASSEARRLRVTVSGAGSVRMCDRDVTDTTDPRKC
jgi:type IV fimbrial biogenesis protein FimT